MASSYLDPARQARLHFTVCHELSHARHRDDLAMLGFEALSQGVSQSLLSYALKQDLRALHHAMGLRCDKDGLEYARAQEGELRTDCGRPARPVTGKRHPSFGPAASPFPVQA